MGPAHLRATHDRVGKEVNQLAQAIGLGHEIRVKDCEQLALGVLVSVFECACLEAGAIVAMDVLNIETLFGVLRHHRFGDVYGLIS